MKTVYTYTATSVDDIQQLKDVFTATVTVRNRNGLLKENETEETMETDEQHCERECVAEVTNAKKSRIVKGTDEQMEDTNTSST